MPPIDFPKINEKTNSIGPFGRKYNCLILLEFLFFVDGSLIWLHITDRLGLKTGQIVDSRLNLQLHDLWIGTAAFVRPVFLTQPARLLCRNPESGFMEVVASTVEALSGKCDGLADHLGALRDPLNRLDADFVARGVLHVHFPGGLGYLHKEWG